MSGINFVKIPFAEVLAEINSNSNREASNTSFLEPTNFNTSFHTQDEAPDVPSQASERPCRFKRWLPLILRNRGLPPTAVQTVTLSRAQARLMLEVVEASLPSGTGKINRMYREDVAEVLAPVFASSLQFPPDGLFMRMEACSAKDGMGKVGGLHSIDEIFRRLCTSYRARNALFEELEANTATFEFFFLPFDDCMRSAREYRVFCPPVSPSHSNKADPQPQRASRVAAISQYRWYEPWIFADLPETEAREIVHKVFHGAEIICKEIVNETDPKDEMDQLLLTQGLTFDLLLDETDGVVQLVELNVFGIRSACGSCLFHWVKDRRVLEGVGTDGTVEFRVTC